MRAIIVTLFFICSTFAGGSEVHRYSVLNNGKVFNYDVINIENNTYTLKRGTLKKSAGEILVAFKEPVDINGFESRYNLSLKSDGVLWKSFKNNSSMSDLELASKITNEMRDSIKTATPNWIVKPSSR